MKNLMRIVWNEYKANVWLTLFWAGVLFISAVMEKFGIGNYRTPGTLPYIAIGIDNAFAKTLGLAAYVGLPVKRDNLANVRLLRTGLQILTLFSMDCIFKLWISYSHLMSFLNGFGLILVIAICFIVILSLYKEVVVRIQTENNWLFKYFAMPAIIAPALIIVVLANIYYEFDSNIIITAVPAIYIIGGTYLMNRFFSKRKSYLFYNGISDAETKTPFLFRLVKKS